MKLVSLKSHIHTAYLSQTLDWLGQRGIWVTGMLSRGRPNPFGTGEVKRVECHKQGN